MQARQVFLFSGHMVDAPGRARPRFPEAKVDAAATGIASVLDRLGAGPGDVALTQGAAGGDLLFAEAVLDRGVALQLLLPLPRPEFVARSVLPVEGGAEWLARFEAVERRLLPDRPRSADDALGPLPEGEDTFVRGNLWLLDTALAIASDGLQLVCLWDGEGADGADGRGGTRHMVDAAQRRGMAITRVDTGSL